jgi:hypothetical protein
VSTPLFDGWSVETTPSSIRLERSTLADRLSSQRRLLTALGSAMTAAALALGGLRAPPGTGLIVWPLVGLFMLVAGLGVWAWRQARVAVATPVFLEVAQGQVSGLDSTHFKALAIAVGNVVRVEVIQAPGLTVPSAHLRIITTDGRLFAGPELIASDEAKALVHQLNEVAAALARRIGCPVKMA